MKLLITTTYNSGSPPPREGLPVHTLVVNFDTVKEAEIAYNILGSDMTFSWGNRRAVRLYRGAA